MNLVYFIRLQTLEAKLMHTHGQLRRKALRILRVLKADEEASSPGDLHPEG